MTLRMDFACVAIAGLALIVADVRAARALYICDVYPERCRYSPSGKGYYYAPGQPMPQGLEPAFVERSGPGSTAGTGTWGCAANDGTAGRMSGAWAASSRAAAANTALAACRQRSTNGSCRIVGCRPSIRTREEARAAWVSGAHR